jgi:hypothetical protein
VVLPDSTNLLVLIIGFPRLVNNVNAKSLIVPVVGIFPFAMILLNRAKKVAVDLIGPLSVNLGFTVIDTATALAECTRFDNKTSDYIAIQFANTCFAHYPKALRLCS